MEIRNRSGFKITLSYEEVYKLTNELIDSLDYRKDKKTMMFKLKDLLLNR